MKIKSTLVLALTVIVWGCSVCYALEVGLAEPVPGFEPTSTISFNYVTSDAQFMLLQVWDPVWRIKSSSWNPITKQWTPPEELPTDPPGGFPNWTGHACLSPDEMTMYYSDSSNHIVRSRKTPDGWTLPPESVSGMDNLLFGTNSFNGTYFYGGVGHPDNGSDIWFSTYDAQSDQFSDAVPVNSINTSEWSELCPWISHDNTLLLFNSNRPGGYGGYDLWYATWDQNSQEWTDITNLGPNINTSLNEMTPYIAEQTGILYFTRRDSSAYPEIIQLMQAQIPEPATFLLLGFGSLALLRKCRS